MTISAAGGRGSSFVDDLRATAPELVDTFEAALDELMAEAAAVLESAAGFDELVTRVVADDEASGRTPPSRLVGRPRRQARRVLLAGGATMAALAATTGLAAASVLPAPVQRAVADVAAHVGLDLPKPTGPTTTVLPPVVSVVIPLEATTLPPSTIPASMAPTPPVPPPTAAPASPATPPAGDASQGVAATTPPSAPEIETPVASEPPTPPVSPSLTLPPSVPPAVRQFHEAVLAFIACMRAAPEPAVGLRTCPFPQPSEFGLGGWPPGIPVPPRSGVAEAPLSSSPPASRFPPAPPPGVTTTLPDDSEHDEDDDFDFGQWGDRDSD